MKIQRTIAHQPASPKQLTPPADQADTEPKFNTKEIVQIGTATLAGAGLGAIPLMGTLSGIVGARANDAVDDKIGTALGIAGAGANIVASYCLAERVAGPWMMALPGILGAVTWGGFAYTAAAQS